MFDYTTNTAFLNAIIEHPDDDAPRLIYADWLDEQGEAERAEFIRLQIQLRRSPADDPTHRRMSLRAAELVQEHGVEWRAAYPQIPGVHWEIYDRGFTSAVRFEWPELFRLHADAVFAAAPITELRLHNYYWQDAQRLAQSPWLRNIHILDLEDGNRIGNVGLEALMESPNTANLRELKLRQNALGSGATRSIAHATHVTSLFVLDLQRNDLYDDGLKALAAAPHLATLRKLDLDRTRASDAGVMALAASPYLRQLQWLSLSGNEYITDVGVQALAASPLLQTVRELYVQANRITGTGIAALAQSPYVQALESLYLRQNRIGDRGVQALIDSPLVESLQNLYVSAASISAASAVDLQRHFGARAVVH